MSTDLERTDPTRERLIDAGLRTYDELPLAKVVAGASTKAVAARAGVTTGSFFHHFANAAEFADALVKSFLQTPNDLTENVEEMVDSLEYFDLLEVMRTTLLDTWQVHSSDEGIRRQIRLQMAFFAHHGQPLAVPDGELADVADVLRQNYRVRHDDAVKGWKHLLVLTGRSFIEPFNLDQIAVALTALFEGLLIRHQMDPDSVDDGLFGDVSAAVAASLTVPQGSRMRLADLGDRLIDQSNLSPQARSGAKRRRATRGRITEAAAGLFNDGWEAVPASDIAEAAGVSNQTVLNLFGSVRGVAAATFGLHVPRIRAAATDTANDDPVHSLQFVLSELAASAARDPEAARAVLGERLATSLHTDPDRTDPDLRVEVPLAEAVLIPLGRMDLGSEDPLEMATMLIDVVLIGVIDRPNRPDGVVATALRLLPRTPT